MRKLSEVELQYLNHNIKNGTLNILKNKRVLESNLKKIKHYCENVAYTGDITDISYLLAIEKLSEENVSCAKNIGYFRNKIQETKDKIKSYK